MSISRPEGMTGQSFENIANKISDHTDYDGEESEDTTKDEVDESTSDDDSDGALNR